MRKIFLYLAVALAIIGCSPQGKKANIQKPTVQENAQDKTSASSKKTAGGKVIYLSTADFKQKVMDYESHPKEWLFAGNRPAVIDFYATWCRPCKMMSPIVEQLAQQYAGKVDFYKVDIDQEPELASIFGIQSIPTFLFIPMKGNPTAQMGMMEKSDMERMIKNIVP